MNKQNRWKIVGLCSFVIVLMACQRQVYDRTDLLLEDGWKVQSSGKVTLAGATLSGLNICTTDWYHATVPSTVMGVLTQNGLYKDVLEGMNYKQIDKTLFDTTWWYRKEFELPALKEGQHVALLFDGISYAANVWLNGCQIATRDSIVGPFRQFRLDITETVEEKNVLAVEVFKGKAGEPNIGFVDWNPRPADESMGIFREVRISMNNEVMMEHAAVRSKVNVETLDEAWLTVETQLTNQSEQSVEGVLKGDLDGKSFQVPIALLPGEVRQVTLSSEQIDLLHLKHPRLWWCHNLGNPDMYQLQMTFEISGEVSDSEVVNFGVREIEDYYTEEGHRGFLLNGKKVLVRSAGWTDDIFLRNSPERYETEVQYVRDMNLNSIRFENIWGTSQQVYDLCDKYGLLALVGWSCHWEWEVYLGTSCDKFGGIKSEKDMDLIAASLKDQILWLRNHPSIIAWLVGSDMLPRPDLEKRYMSFLPQIDNRIYLAAAKELTSELTGSTGMKMVGPYDYVTPNYWYLEEAKGGAFGFNTETGIGAQLPVIESLRKMIPADKLWPLNEIWDYHCTTAAENMHSLDVLKESVAKRYGEPENLDDFLRKADLLNYEGTRAMFEAFRVRIPRTTGIVQWMLNSAWPSVYWQLYDYYLIPTAAYYSVKKSNMPQQLIYDYAQQAVFAVNECLETCRMQANLSIYNVKGQRKGQQTKTIEIAPYTVTKVFDVPAVDAVVFLFLTLNNEEGTFITDNFYCLSDKPDELEWEKTTWIRTPMKDMADFSSLSSMHQSVCQANAVVEYRGDSTVISVTLKTTPSTFAFFVRLSLKDEEGELLRPVFWQDNYFTLAPGDERTIQCVVPDTITYSGEVTLNVSGWNLPEQSIPLLFRTKK